MKKILVSLVSDQTIPNILAIQHFAPDELLFVTTRDMERKNKTRAIVDTLALMGLVFENRAHQIEVREDSILDIRKKIEAWMEGREDSQFIVNLTCGTKIMSVATYEYFKEYGSTMVYIPIAKNEYITPFPKKSSNRPVSLEGRLSVTEYLTAYGLKVDNRHKLKGHEDDAAQRAALTDWITVRYERLKNLLVWFSGNLRAHRSDREWLLTGTFSKASSEEAALLERLKFSVDGENVSKRMNRSLITYLTGGWLEEYCFNQILQYRGCGIDDAVIGISLRNSRGRDNEFDVMFTRNNALYFVECKSLDMHDVDYKDVLYKIGALQKDFGLKVESFWVTTSQSVVKDGRLRQSVEGRAEQFNTLVVPPSAVIDFGSKVAEKLNLEAPA